jgi:ubiquinone/menaquinone biosynthesis C-methylase UbiE
VRTNRTAHRSPGVLPKDLAEAYDATAAAWAVGPARVYDRLASVLVDRTPVPLAGRLVLDVGAGTGAAGRAVRRAGGHPLAVDLSAAMLRADQSAAGRAVVADARRLPVADAGVDGLVAAFSFNHLPEPADGMAEARRVCRPGSPVLVAAYAADDDHPVKAAVDQAAAEAGWSPAGWYRELRDTVATRLSTTAGMADAADRAGLDRAVEVEHVVVELAGLTVADLVAWRLGMAQLAPFLAGLGPAARQRVGARARALLGEDPPPLRRSLVVLAAVV